MQGVSLLRMAVLGVVALVGAESSVGVGVVGAQDVSGGVRAVVAQVALADASRVGGLSGPAVQDGRGVDLPVVPAVSGESAWVLRVFLTLETGMMEHGNYRCAAEAAEVSGRAA